MSGRHGNSAASNRQLGKVLILALGFGMGAIKLRENARKGYGVQMTAAEAERFKSGWRQRNHRIVGFWHEMEFAARAAILRRGNVIPVGGSGIAFTCPGKTLQMRLPSGRVLYYHQPRLGPRYRQHHLLGRRGRRALGGAADMGRQIGGKCHASGSAGHHGGSDAAGVAARRARALHDRAR